MREIVEGGDTVRLVTDGLEQLVRFLELRARVGHPATLHEQRTEVERGQSGKVGRMHVAAARESIPVRALGFVQRAEIRVSDAEIDLAAELAERMIEPFAQLQRPAKVQHRLRWPFL